MAKRHVALACALAVWMLTPAATAADASQLMHVARAEALNKLLEQVRSLKTGDRTVGEILDGVAAPITWEAALGGAEQERPARYDGTGTCEVTVRIAAERLRKNLGKLLEAHAPDAKAGPDTLRIGVPYLTASGTFAEPRSWRQPEKLVHGPPKGLEEWQGVDALDTAKVERAALAQARSALRGHIAPLLKDVPKAETLTPLLMEGVMARSKAYVAGGIVEVRIRAKAADLLERLRARLEAMEAKDRPLTKEELDAAAKKLSDRTFATAGYADLKGKTPDGAKLFRHVPLTTAAFPGFIPKPRPEKGASPEKSADRKTAAATKGDR